ncbi:MAG: iron-containing alcohol dehydrogenase [Candidatus Omnitrophica bacterium]|nr:iron-containing alcohol dehydrogenase [Candidatus Omnitrophota bacterium]
MDFPKELLLPQKTIYEIGSVSRLAEESLEYGPRGLIVHGSSLEKDGKKERILANFSSSDRVGCFLKAGGEPTLTGVEAVIKKARSVKAEWIAGIGGGSTIDLAKAAAGLYNAKEKPVFYQEGGRLERSGIPFIAVPTTAGTGSEATINSVIINNEKNVKLSIRDESFLARKVILDAGLLKWMPLTPMSYAAMDAYAQAYESYISKSATWLSEVLALKAIDLINRNILPAYESGSEENLSSLLLGSYLAGIALATSRLGVIHGIAHPLGVLHNLPHGLICSVCFIPSIKLNKGVIGKKYEAINKILGEDLRDRIEKLLNSLNINSPFKGKRPLEKEKVIEDTLRSGSTAANPKRIERGDVEFMLKELF